MSPGRSSPVPARIAFVATTGAAVLVLLLYAPVLEAPFLVPKFAALELTASLGAIALLLSRATAGGPRWSRPVGVGVSLVIGTTVASWLLTRGHAPYAEDALARWGSLFGLACGASVLADDRDARARLVEAIAFAASVVACLGLLQHVGMLPRALAMPVFSLPGSTFGNRNIAAEIMAMALPLSVAATLSSRERDARVRYAVATILELVFLAVTRARGAWFGAACGLVATLWLLRAPLRASFAGSRRTLLVFGGVALLAVVAAAVPGRFTTHDMGDTKRYASALSVIEGAVDPQSAALRTRLGFWRRTLRMIEDAPLLGVGPGNWPVIYPRYAEPGATRDGALSMTLAPRQAHNDLLERAAETGLLGLGALLFLGAAVVHSTRARLNALRAQADDAGAVTAGAAGALVALAGLSLASFPLEMPGTLALAGLALGFVVVPDPSRVASARPAWIWPVVALATTLVVCLSIRIERRARGSYWHAVAERALHRDGGTAGAQVALAALARAREATPGSFITLLRIAQMQLRMRQPALAEAAAKDALELEPYSVNACGALATANRVAGHLDDARDAADRALAILQDYPPALYVRATVAETNGLDLERAATDREKLKALAEQSEDKDVQRTARALLETGE